MNSGQSPYPTLNEDSPEPEPMSKQEKDREDEQKYNDKLKKRDTSTPRRYSKRASEKNGLLLDQNGLPQPINPMIQHRQSIKKKVTINANDIFGDRQSKTDKSMMMKSNHAQMNGHRQSQINHHNQYQSKNKRNSIKHQQHKGAPITRAASAPRTSQQFNPQSLKKRQSQQFQQTLPTIMSQNHSSSSQRRRSSQIVKNQHHVNVNNGNVHKNHNNSNTNNNNKENKATTNGKEDGNCLIM